MSKIFVRERRHAGRRTGRPRFAIVAVQGVDLQVFVPRIRRIELKALASEIGAEVVYLPRGEQGKEPQDEGGTFEVLPSRRRDPNPLG